MTDPAIIRRLALVKLRAVAVMVLLVADACSDPVTPGSGDAGPDAAVDAPAQVDATLGGVRWLLTWSCSSECSLARPALTYSNVLNIDGSSLHWSSTTCSECARDHVGTLHATCLDVPAAVEGVDDRAAFSVCLGGAGIIADISVKRVGGDGSSTTWHMVGAQQ